MNTQTDLFNYLVRLGDDRLVFGHRISEWCGHGPMLEEDLALANIALDLIGQAGAFYTLAGQIEGKGRTEDDFAYLRDPKEFLNMQIVEQPRGDFAQTIAKLFIFSSFDVLFLPELMKSNNSELSALASKSFKESKYHFRHSSQWILRLGDGTTESHNKIQDALNEYWKFTSELFFMNKTDESLIEAGAAPDLLKIKPQWTTQVEKIILEATLKIPNSMDAFSSSGRNGAHSEHLTSMLTEMQVLPRTYPGAVW